ncbi:hypothetical protein CVT26_003600 [Gymnopilus dilepis]|uniref:Uncharacterized protein n=1 Tax=Gymnopilus dilepis TaxID=231916 RepID=A0A409W1X4_9AGAR|nr:hypothetical protein CVT26_003600 [Gymnopilus dilepis]
MHYQLSPYNLKLGTSSVDTGETTSETLQRQSPVKLLAPEGTLSSCRELAEIFLVKGKIGDILAPRKKLTLKEASAPGPARFTSGQGVVPAIPSTTQCPYPAGSAISTAIQHDENNKAPAPSSFVFVPKSVYSSVQELVENVRDLGDGGCIFAGPVDVTFFPCDILKLFLIV